jgi:hypothetical protein
VAPPAFDDDLRFAQGVEDLARQLEITSNQDGKQHGKSRLKEQSQGPRKYRPSVAVHV